MDIIGKIKDLLDEDGSKYEIKQLLDDLADHVVDCKDCGDGLVKNASCNVTCEICNRRVCYETTCKKVDGWFGREYRQCYKCEY